MYKRQAVGFELVSDNGFRNHSGFDQQKIILKNFNNIQDWSLQTLISFTNLNQETAGYINSYFYPTRIENINPEAYRDAKSLRIKTEISRGLKKYNIYFTPYLRFSSMEFIQHYLPGKPIEKNGQKSTGLTIKLSEIEINDNFFEIGSQVEIAFINLDQFQPDVLNSPNAFNLSLIHI